MLCWATQLGPTWRTDAHDRSLLIGLIPLASCIEYSLAKEQPQEAHHCLVDDTSGYGFPCCRFQARLTTAGGSGKPSTSSPVDHKGNKADRISPGGAMTSVPRVAQASSCAPSLANPPRQGFSCRLRTLGRRFGCCGSSSRPCGPLQSPNYGSEKTSASQLERSCRPCWRSPVFSPRSLTQSHAWMCSSSGLLDHFEARG